ncbi:hypothetical protein FGO68_gene11747 [Halteria grandinella]|uniref:Uncharacterized protein n=1 Tax=Halteria grandinella TaxID=5974 RepID=A0A8J8NYK5_HALGN|nr:hypothetical protein FGO68_gene11747 [Halteria grandinella]
MDDPRHVLELRHELIFALQVREEFSIFFNQWSFCYYVNFFHAVCIFIESFVFSLIYSVLTSYIEAALDCQFIELLF